jgi:hypothetical protein
MLDLQQLATSLIDPSQISQKVIASVVSYYPGRVSNDRFVPVSRASISRREKMGQTRPFAMQGLLR